MSATDAAVSSPISEKIPFDSTHVLVGGVWRPGQSGQHLELINPSDGSFLASIARGQAADIDAAVSAAQAALDDPQEGSWGRLSAAERGRILLRMSEHVLAHADELARLEALDVGKPLRQGRADAVALARYLEFYGGAADKVHGQSIPFANGYTAFSIREPHGVTAHIVPWNYPMQIIGRSVGAALAMGNACVLKPAEEACLTAMAFAYIAQQAGLPAGALNVVPGLGEEAGAALSMHPGVRHISFTGSVQVGTLIQTSAARNAIPVTLELGGKSPQIVFADADLDAALPFLVNAGIQNAGQTCSAASRIYVPKSLWNEVRDRCVAMMKQIKMGDVADFTNFVGAVIDAGSFATQRDAIEEAKRRGFRVSGPYAGDTVFFRTLQGEFDCAIAMSRYWSVSGGHARSHVDRMPATSAAPSSTVDPFPPRLPVPACRAA